MKVPASLPKAAVYLACIMLVAHPRITAQAPEVPEQALDIHPIGPDMVLEWQSVVGRTYFLQLSGGLAPPGTGPALLNWAWADVIEEGHGGIISHEFGGNAPHGFARLHYTDEPRPSGVSLEEWDTDGDGISNFDEINPPGGFAQTNPLNPDTDGDGLGDGWERSFATRMLALGAPPEHWGDNWPALQSGNLHPQATLQDGGMNIREIHDATSLHDPEMILQDLFIQAKRAEFVFWVFHDSHVFDDNTPTLNEGGGFLISGSSGYGSGSIETWSRTSPDFLQLEVQSDPFSVTPETSLVWFANESGAAIWTYHTHWDQAGDPNPGTLFPIKNMGQSSVTYQLTHGGDSQYYQFQATGPPIYGQVTTKTRWSGETRKSEFRLYRPHPTKDPVSRTFLKVTTEYALVMIGGDPSNVRWSDAPPVTTVETITATIPAFGHTSGWIETSPEPAAQKYRTVDLRPVEFKTYPDDEPGPYKPHLGNLATRQDEAGFYGERRKCVAHVWQNQWIDLIKYLKGADDPTLRELYEDNLDWRSNGHAVNHELNWVGEPGEDDITVYLIEVLPKGGNNVIDSLYLTVVPRSTKQGFDAWYNAEKADIAWLQELPPVFNRIDTTPGTDGYIPRPDRNFNPYFYGVPNENNTRFHPDGYFEQRSYKTPGGHGHQVWFDDGGVLLESGVSAGSADKAAAFPANLNPFLHVEADVKPFMWALHLDGNPARQDGTNLTMPIMHEGVFLGRYIEVRSVLPNGKPRLEPGATP